MKSVKSIQKITKAMKMVAASKLRAIQTRAENSRGLWQPFTALLGDTPSMFLKILFFIYLFFFMFASQVLDIFFFIKCYFKFIIDSKLLFVYAITNNNSILFDTVSNSQPGLFLLQVNY